MARNTDPAPRRRGRARASPRRGRQRRNRRWLACISPGAAVVVRALLVEGLAKPVAGSGSCCFRLRGCCSPVSCLLRPAVHAAGPPWLPVVRRLVPLQRSPPSPACEPGCAGGFRCSGWLVRPWYPCGLSQPQGRGGRDRPASQDPLRRAVAAAAADQGAPTAAPASAGGAHLPPALQGARGSGCCRPHRGRAGTRCSNPATRGGDGCAEWRARKQWVAQRRTLPSGGARSRTRIAGLARSLRPPRRWEDVRSRQPPSQAAAPHQGGPWPPYKWTRRPWTWAQSRRRRGSGAPRSRASIRSTRQRGMRPPAT